MPQYKLSEKEGKLQTYTYANNTKAQIDCMFINKKWNYSGLNFKAYSSFECVLRLLNCHGNDTTDPTKEYGPNNNHCTL